MSSVTYGKRVHCEYLHYWVLLVDIADDVVISLHLTPIRRKQNQLFRPWKCNRIMRIADERLIVINLCNLL